MRESTPYKTELRASARLLAARARRQVWRNDSLCKAEKMVFIGFFIIRKLIECRKVTDRCARESVEIQRGAMNRSRVVSDFLRDDLYDDLDHVRWSGSKIDVRQLADKVIHAWWIAPTAMGEGLGGFIFTTDQSRSKELLFLSSSATVQVFETFANDEVAYIQAERNDVGELRYRKAGERAT
jgi:hypothetical protein